MPGRRHAKRDCSLTPRHPCQAKTSRPRPRELFLHHHKRQRKNRKNAADLSKIFNDSMRASHGGLQSRSVTTHLRRKKATTSGTHTQHTTRAHSLALSRAPYAHTLTHTVRTNSASALHLFHPRKRILESGLGDLVMCFIA